MPLMSLTAILALLDSSKYFLLFAGAFLEGTVVMMSAGLLWRLGDVQFWPMYGALILGDILSDMMWYYIGYFGARPFVARWGYLVGAPPELVDKIGRRFKHHQNVILVVSKLTMGFGLMIATLIAAGVVRISAWRLFIINLVCGFIWIFFLIMIGYYFGNIFLYVAPQLQIAFAVIGIAGVFFLLRYIAARLAQAEW